MFPKMIERYWQAQTQNKLTRRRLTAAAVAVVNVVHFFASTSSHVTVVGYLSPYYFPHLQVFIPNPLHKFHRITAMQLDTCASFLFFVSILSLAHHFLFISVSSFDSSNC